MTTPERPRARWSRLLLAALLATAGVAHVVMPEPFEKIIPDWLPGTPQLWNGLATVAELGSAGLLSNRRTARMGGLAAFATFAAVWVANVQAALDGGYRALPGWAGTQAAAWVRVPLQIPLLWWAAAIARGSQRHATAQMSPAPSDSDR